MRRGAFNPRLGPKHQELLNVPSGVQNVMDKLRHGPPRARERPVSRQAAITSAHVDQGMSNLRTNFEENEAPVFTTYEKYHQTVLRSFKNISIVMSIDGKVAFISQNVLPLLGHRPEDIVGKTLLNIILDKQKDEISQKIILHLPLANAVGRLIEFCCCVRKGNAYRNAQQRYAARGRYEDKEIYECVKFMLYLQDSYDESFVAFGNYGSNSRNFWSSASRLLGKQQYYLVGTITVFCKPPELEHPTEIQSNVIVIDSDDDSTIQHRRLEKRRRRNELKKICLDEASNMEHIDSDSEIEIMDIRPPTRQRSLGKTVQTRTSPPLSTSRNISATTSKSTDSVQESMTDSNNLVKPVNIKLEVPPEFFLNDSQEEEGSPEQEGGSGEHENKSLEEAKTSNSKEHIIDEITVLPNSSSYEDCCEITEDSKDKTNNKTLEIVVDQESGCQKVPETSPTILNTREHVRPEAVQIDQSASGITEDREREQCIHELAQRNEMLRGLYDLPQTGQGQANWACQPQEQMVTAINDLGSGPVNFYGNDNSEHVQNQTNRLLKDPVDCTPLLRPHPSASSCQTMTMPHQPLTMPHRPLETAGYQPAESQYSLTRPQDPPTWSHSASSYYVRMKRQHSPQPGQDNTANFLTEENTINPYP